MQAAHAKRVGRSLAAMFVKRASRQPNLINLSERVFSLRAWIEWSAGRDDRDGICLQNPVRSLLCCIAALSLRSLDVPISCPPPLHCPGWANSASLCRCLMVGLPALHSWPARRTVRGLRRVRRAHGRPCVVRSVSASGCEPLRAVARSPSPLRLLLTLPLSSASLPHLPSKVLPVGILVGHSLLLESPPELHR